MPSRGWSQYLIRHKVIKLPKLLPNCRGSHLPWEPDAQFKSKKYIWDWKIIHFFSIIVHLKWKCVHRPLINKEMWIQVLFGYLQSTTKKPEQLFYTLTTLSLSLSLSHTHTHTHTHSMLNSHKLSTVGNYDFLFGFPIFWSLSLRKQYRHKAIRKQDTKETRIILFRKSIKQLQRFYNATKDFHFKCFSF